MHTPGTIGDASDTGSPAPDGIRAWATGVAHDSLTPEEQAVQTNITPSSGSIASRSNAELSNEISCTQEGGGAHFYEAPAYAAIEIGNSTPETPSERSVQYYVLRSSTRAAIMHSLNNASCWPVSRDIGKRISKAIMDDQTVVVFIGADDTRHFVACAQVVGVKQTGPNDFLPVEIQHISLSELLAAGRHSSMSSLGSGPSFSDTEYQQNAREYKIRGLEASIWNLTKEEMMFQRRKVQLMAELVQLRQQSELSLHVKVPSTGRNSPVSRPESANSTNKIIGKEPTRCQEESPSANEGDSKGSSSSWRLVREKDDPDANLRRTVFAQALKASRSKSFVAEEGSIHPSKMAPIYLNVGTADAASSSNMSRRADVSSIADSPIRLPSDVISNEAGTAHSSSTPETSNNPNTYREALETQESGANTANLKGSVIDNEEVKHEKGELSNEPDNSQVNAFPCVVLNVVLLNPLPFTRVAEEQVRNKWHNTFSLRQQRGRLVHKAHDGTELAPGTGYDILALWAESEETPICRACGRHWTMTRSGMEGSTTDSELLSDSPSDNDKDSREPST